MEIISFEDAKARKQSKVRNQLIQKITKQSLETDDCVSELQRQYQNNAHFYNQWYADHVIGQDKDGRWLYKDL